MKKAVVAVVLIPAVVAVVFAFKSFLFSSAAAGAQTSERAAASLQSKIDTIKRANDDKNRRVQQKLEISEPELESYVLVALKEDIPVRIESMRVRLTPGAIAADTRLTIPPGGTGNALVDALVDGTHNLYVKGKLIGAKGEGKFDLQDVRVDGIPVPNILVDTLIKRYAKPKYPDVDLKEPFDLPWGIDAIDIGQGKATITY